MPMRRATTYSEQYSSHHAVQRAAHLRQEHAVVQDRPSYSGAMLGNRALRGRGNGPVQIALMTEMQQTHGNRAMQRFLQRATSRQSAVPVQRCGGQVHAGCKACGGDKLNEEQVPVARSVALQRITADEKAINLKSTKYAGNPRLENAFDNSPAMGIGEVGDAVRLVQEGLVADGFAMPKSTNPSGALDGAFGQETLNAVRQFQSKHGLSPDGRVGRQTMGKLDELADSGQTIPACQLPPGEQGTDASVGEDAISGGDTETTGGEAIPGGETIQLSRQVAPGATSGGTVAVQRDATSCTIPTTPARRDPGCDASGKCNTQVVPEDCSLKATPEERAACKENCNKKLTHAERQACKDKKKLVTTTDKKRNPIGALDNEIFRELLDKPTGATVKKVPIRRLALALMPPDPGKQDPEELVNAVMQSVVISSLPPNLADITPGDLEGIRTGLMVIAFATSETVTRGKMTPAERDQVQKSIAALMKFFESQKTPTGGNTAVNAKRQAVISIAMAQVGSVRAKEKGGKEGNKDLRLGHARLLEFFNTAYGSPGSGRYHEHEVKFLGPGLQDWCGIFLLWAYKSAGVDVGTWQAGATISEVAGMEAIPDSQVQPGDNGLQPMVKVFDKEQNKTVEKNTQHQFIVAAVDGKSLTTIEGNTDGGGGGTGGEIAVHQGKRQKGATTEKGAPNMFFFRPKDRDK
jgi:peptidoglycan hydrolase-like protein with peptidoglycan-binding domain